MKNVIMLAICALAFPIASSAQSSQICKTTELDLGCPAGYRTSYWQSQNVESMPNSNEMSYSYRGYEYGTSGKRGEPALLFPQIPGIVCGSGSSNLSVRINGNQANDLYEKLNLPERVESTIPFDVYKRLNTDGTTISKFKGFNITCIRRLNPKSGLKIDGPRTTLCYLNVGTIPTSQRVSSRFPCDFDNKAYQFEGEIVGTQAQKIVDALGQDEMAFHFSNGTSSMTCQNHSKYGKSCKLKVELNR